CVAAEADAEHAVGTVVEEGMPGAIVRSGPDLVAEHRPRGRRAELLDVRAAQAARLDGQDLTRADGLADFGQCGQSRVIEDDRPHGGIVGGAVEQGGGRWRSSFTGAATSG